MRRSMPQPPKPPRYVQLVRSKAGKAYPYFRRGVVREKLPHDMASPEFWEMYAELLRRAEEAYKRTPEKRCDAPRRGSIGWLIREFRASSEYPPSPRTRMSYELTFARLAPIASFAIGALERRHVRKMRDALRETPAAADKFVSHVRKLYAWAMDDDLVTHNPADRLKRLARDEHYERWTDDECLRFEGHPHALDIRIAYHLGLYTGQRIGDCIRLGPEHLSNGRIVMARAMAQEKTAQSLVIPVHRSLAAFLVGLPDRGSGPWVRDGRGKPYRNAASLSARFGRALDAAGLGHLQFHGLRATAASRLAEAGCTVHEIAAITGHRDLRVLQGYTAGVDQQRMAGAAMKKMERRG